MGQVLAQQPALAQLRALAQLVLLLAPPLHSKQALAQVPEQGSKLVPELALEQGSKLALAQEQALQVCIQVLEPVQPACSSTPFCGI